MYNGINFGVGKQNKIRIQQSMGFENKMKFGYNSLFLLFLLLAYNA